MLLSVVFAVPGALWAARHPRGVVDTGLDGLWTVSLSLPAFIVGIFLTYFLSVRAGLLPTRGYVPFVDDPLDNLKHFVLPALTLALAGAPLLYRFLRASLLEEMNAPYIRTARGKGLTERPVVLRHAFRNSLGPSLTMLGLIVGYTLGGTVIIEYVFGIPGLGSLAIESVLNRDYNVLQSVVILVSATFILTSLVVDVLFAALDPRHRLVARVGDVTDTAVGAAPAVRRSSRLPLAAEPGCRGRGVDSGPVILAVIAAPLLTSYGPYTIDPTNSFSPPSTSHWFGTDELGRDLFSRMLYGGRVTLGAMFGATALSMVIGIVWGFAAALGLPVFDEILMRLADVAMAIPQILFGLVFIAAFGTSLVNLIVIVGIVLGPTSARLVRSVVLSEREADYVRAAVAFGATRWSIAAKEIFPEHAPHLGVLAAINMANALLLEAAFSFVGLGVQPPRASWGTILQQGYSNIYYAFYYAAFPAAAIVLVLLLLNVLARSLQVLVGHRVEVTVAARTLEEPPALAVDGLGIQLRARGGVDAPPARRRVRASTSASGWPSSASRGAARRSPPSR